VQKKQNKTQYFAELGKKSFITAYGFTNKGKVHKLKRASVLFSEPLCSPVEASATRGIRKPYSLSRLIGIWWCERCPGSG